MKRAILVNLAFVLLSSASAPAVTRLVPSIDYPTIQAAINGCNDGDVVIVAPGTYTGDGNRDIDFLGKGITVRSTDPNDPNIVAATIIDCNGTETEPHRGFYFHSEEDGNAVIAGFTIRNGYASGPHPVDDSGGGILCWESSPTITNCTITSNWAGGGVESCVIPVATQGLLIAGSAAITQGSVAESTIVPVRAA